ncbi:hypothetical protein OEZ85_003014 [Tetradesmus obliquus]|uniref:Uncharacterized protein n=1 Tax=Tetradesmus obliquus TaxID=3088 RepID=A0ABY8U217_TETOB|nr:hypothetical protein OEZ85_003014 [Tetradesmus obliquus]
MIGLQRHGDAGLEDAALYPPANASNNVYDTDSVSLACDESCASWLQGLDSGSTASASSPAIDFSQASWQPAHGRLWRRL